MFDQVSIISELMLCLVSMKSTATTDSWQNQTWHASQYDYLQNINKLCNRISKVNNYTWWHTVLCSINMCKAFSPYIVYLPEHLLIILGTRLGDMRKCNRAIRQHKL